MASLRRKLSMREGSGVCVARDCIDGVAFCLRILSDGALESDDLSAGEARGGTCKWRVAKVYGLEQTCIS
jgi:hypothetical protein